MGELDATGELMTGALAARAIEPRTGESRDESHALCLNCGTALIGAHCHRCGQAGHVHRSIGAIGHEILHGVVHFEGKLWRTLPLLAWRPGDLTRRYIAGERARFVSPMALFLFSIFTMFAVFSIAGIGPPADLPPSAATVDAALAQTRDGMVKARAASVGERDALPAGDPRRAALERDIAGIDRQIASLATINASEKGGWRVNFDKRKTGWAALDKGLSKAEKNPSLLLYKLQANSYKFSWLLIPLSLPFVWLLFAWKRQYKLYDHAVFITYSIAFMSLLFIVVTIFGAIGIGEGVIAATALLVPPVHLYRQLRGAYRLPRVTALIRTVLLGLAIVIVLTLFLLLLLGLGLVG